jgi:hypothetical protein
MSAVLKGMGIVWSEGGITFTAGIVSATNLSLPQSANFSRTSEKTDIKGNGGTVLGQVFHGFKKVLSITVIPYHATTIAGAITSKDAHVLKPGTTITVADASGTLMDDSYNLLSSREGRTVDGVVTVDLEMETSDESVTLTSAVT